MFSAAPTLVASNHDREWLIGQGPTILLLNGSSLQELVGLKNHLPASLGPAIEDREGNLWITTPSDGVARLRLSLMTTAVESIFKDGRSPRSLNAGLQGKVNVAAFSGLVSIQGQSAKTRDLNDTENLPRQSSLKTQPNRKLPILRQECIAASPHDDQTLWVGLSLAGIDSPRTVAALKLNDDECIPLLAKVRSEAVHFYTCDAFPIGVRDSYSIAVRQDGEVWLGTNVGVFVLRQGELQHQNATTQSLPIEAVSLLADSRDRILVGGYESGLHVFAENASPEIITLGDGLPSNTVVSLFEDSNGAIWAGTDKGLSRIQGKRLDTFQDGADFLEGRVSSVVEDEAGNLWFGTPKGIFAVKPDAFDELLTDKRDSLGALRFGKRDGMPNENVIGDVNPTSIRASDGTLYFSVQNALVRTDPKTLLAAVVAPLIEVKKCSSPDAVYYDRDQPNAALSRGRLSIPAEAQSVLMFDYAAHTLSFPEETRYEYRLKGVSEVWQKAEGQSRSMFTRLTPGDYFFEVRAFNHNDSVSEIASFPFHLQPFYYQTTTFRLGISFGLIAVAYLCYRWRLGYRDRIHALEKQLELDAEHSRIARDMHDEIGSNLGQMRLLGELARDLDTGNPKYERIAGQIEELALRCSKSLREMIWSLAPSTNSYSNLSDYIHDLVETFFEHSTITPKVIFWDHGEELTLPPNFRRELVMIVKGILSNSLIHSQATRFEITVKINNDALDLVASDDGIGFDPAVLATDAYGLRAIRERTENLGGHLQLDSQPNCGTRFQIRFPLFNKKPVTPTA